MRCGMLMSTLETTLQESSAKYAKQEDTQIHIDLCRYTLETPSSQSNRTPQKLMFQRIFSCWLGSHVGACFLQLFVISKKVTHSPWERPLLYIWPYPYHIPSCSTTIRLTFEREIERSQAAVCSNAGLEKEAERDLRLWLAGHARHTLGMGGGVIGK